MIIFYNKGQMTLHAAQVLRKKYKANRTKAARKQNQELFEHYNKLVKEYDEIIENYKK